MLIFKLLFTIFEKFNLFKKLKVKKFNFKIILFVVSYLLIHIYY